MAFNGDICLDLAAQFLTLAEGKGATAPVLMARTIMGHTSLQTGDFNQARTHYDKGIALYDPNEHRPLATRFGQDIRVAILSYRSLALWLLGYPEAALRGADDAIKYGRETGQAASLMFALYMAAILHILCGKYSVATKQAKELFALAEEKGALLWKASGMIYEGCVLAATGKASEAIEMLIAGTAAYRSTGATAFMPWFLLYLTRAFAKLGQFDDAWRCIVEATTAVAQLRKDGARPSFAKARVKYNKNQGINAVAPVVIRSGSGDQHFKSPPKPCQSLLIRNPFYHSARFPE